MFTTDEIWKPIPGFEDRYAVSDRGRVRSLRTKKILKLDVSEANKYPRVRLGRGRSRYVHQLVATTFIGERPAGMYVLHRNDDAEDNAVENLYFGTPSQNLRDAVRNGKHAMANRTHCPHGHEYTEANTRLYQGRRFCIACATITHCPAGHEYTDTVNRRGRRTCLACKITHCHRGHEFTEANTKIYQGSRHCRSCARIRQDEFYARRRALAAA